MAPVNDDEKNQHTTVLLGVDFAGSVLTTQNDQQRDNRSYTVYGDKPSVDPEVCKTGFVGELMDNWGGHYLLGNGVRAYAKGLMRFRSPDTLSPFGAGGINSYMYCLGDPVNLSDRTGRAPGPASLKEQAQLVIYNTEYQAKTPEQTLLLKFLNPRPNSAFNRTKKDKARATKETSGTTHEQFYQIAEKQNDRKHLYDYVSAWNAQEFIGKFVDPQTSLTTPDDRKPKSVLQHFQELGLHGINTGDMDEILSVVEPYISDFKVTLSDPFNYIPATKLLERIRNDQAFSSLHEQLYKNARTSAQMHSMTYRFPL